MNTIVRNTLAVIAGLLIGGSLNGFIIMISPSIIPPPIGADFTTEQGLLASMHLMQPKHFVMPFLAHALGTFLGALITASVAASHKMMLAICIGVTFLAGGIMMVLKLPSPIWFTVLDLGAAYILMAYLAAKLVLRKSN